MRSSSAAPARWASVLPIAWFLVLIAPATLTLSASDTWDLNPTQLLVASAWGIVCLRLLLPPRVFLLLTYPIALFGLACVGADALRNVNLLELAAEWNTYSRADVAQAAAPYLSRCIGLALVLAVLCWLAARSSGGHELKARIRYAAVVVGTGVLALLLPSATWPRAWPINAGLVGAAYLANSPALAHGSTSVMLSSPRKPHGSWAAVRASPPVARQTMVMIIGESVRSDFMKECGGPDKVRGVHAGAVVACDVTAGADATHTSVPLLISREWPGHAVRVSDDATFQRAFEEVGFHTYWYDTQNAPLAWPDAGTQAYPSGPDAEELLPLLERTLATGEDASSIVLHTYGAHADYCVRFDTKTAPYGTACPLPRSDGPTRADLAQWRRAYAGAVDATVDFLNQVIDRLDRLPGEAFLVYTPDHGENLLDDGRELYGHALRHPTVWDSRVPAVFWANAAWKAAHPAQWAQLEANARAPLMHADLVPTLLAAAQIRYQDTQRPAADLLKEPVRPRQRVVQKAIGAAIPWEEMVREAADHRGGQDPAAAASP